MNAKLILLTPINNCPRDKHHQTHHAQYHPISPHLRGALTMIRYTFIELNVRQIDFTECLPKLSYNIDDDFLYTFIVCIYKLYIKHILIRIVRVRA